MESKDYGGWIFGAGNDKEWTQVMGERKFKLYNPVKQDIGHINCLSKRLCEDVPFYQVIVLSDRGTLKKNICNTPDTYIIN